MAEALIYPYEVLDSEPTLTVSSPRLDGVPYGALLPRHNLVDLHSIEVQWHRVRLRAHLQMPADRVRRLVDTAERYDVVVTVHCPSTNLRYAVAMQADPNRPGSFSVEVELERALLHQRAHIDAVVAGTVDGVNGRYLARSNAVDVQLAAIRIPDISGDLNINWRRFDESHEGLTALDPAMHDQLSYLELDGPQSPRLWLNSAVEGFRRLLDERQGRGRAETAMRLAVFDGIATSAMVAMFNTALAAAADLDLEDGDAWPGEWKAAVLRSLLPLMYPDRDVDDALQHVLSTRDADGVLDVQERLHTAAARQLKTNVNAKRAVRALEEDQA